MSQKEVLKGSNSITLDECTIDKIYGRINANGWVEILKSDGETWFFSRLSNNSARYFTSSSVFTTLDDAISAGKLFQFDTLPDFCKWTTTAE